MLFRSNRSANNQSTLRGFLYAVGESTGTEGPNSPLGGAVLAMAGIGISAMMDPSNPPGRASQPSVSEPKPLTWITYEGRQYPLYAQRDAAKLPPGKGMIFVLEGADQRARNASMTAAQAFEAATPGAMSDMETGKRISVAWRYENTVTNGTHVVRFDGMLSPIEVIDAKYNTDSMNEGRKSLEDARRQEKALLDNPELKAVWELPTERKAMSAESKLRRALGIGRIGVRTRGK